MTGMLLAADRTGSNTDFGVDVGALAQPLDSVWMLPGEHTALLAITGLLVTGLLGLALDDDPDDPLSELVATVERLADGECDVEFPTDRDDEIGQLSESLQEIADQLEEQTDPQTEQLHQLKAIVENTDHMAYVKDTDGVYQYVNEAATTVVDCDRSGMIGKTDYELFDADLYEEFIEGDTTVLENETSVSQQRVVEVDGEPRVYFDNKYPYYNEDGELSGVLGITHDITERRERERDLEQSRDHTDKLLDALDDIFFVLDEDGTLQGWNEKLVTVTGYSDEELDGKAVLSFFESEYHDQIETAIAEGFEQGEQEVEAELLTKSGETIPYEFISTRLEDPAGNPILTGIGRDITERKGREQRLRERERELSTLIETVPGIVYHARNEPDWPFEFVSDGAVDVTGYESEALESGEVNWAEDVIVDDNGELWETVQNAIEADEPYQTTYRIETPDGERRWLWEQGRAVFEDGELAGLEGVILDVTEQKERQEQLERTTDLLEQTQQIASVGGWEMDVTLDPPYGGKFTDELYRIHEIPIGEPVDMEKSLEYYPPEDRDRLREAVETAIETGEGYELEARFITAKGNKRWIRTAGVPVFEDGELVKLRGALQDITEQKERELALESLQEISQRLLGTESETEVAKLVVDRAAEVVDTAAVAIYLLDGKTNRLEPTAASQSFLDTFGDPQSVPTESGTSILWDAFVRGTQTVLNPNNTADSRGLPSGLESGIAVPMDDYGVFVVATTDPTIGEQTEQLTETLAATTEAALNRLNNEALLREREQELEAQNDQLRRQMQINTIIRSVHTSLAGSDSREGIERTVCERLVEAEDIQFAWIGTLDAGDDELGVRAWDGSGGAYLDGYDFDAETGTEPAVETIRSGKPTVVENVVDGLGADDWRQRALQHDFHSIVSVPLSVDEFSVGVLTVYANKPDVFSTFERTVFSELAESIANSIAAVNARRALQTDTLVELTLRLGSDSFFSRLVQSVDCTIEYEGIVPHDDEQYRLFITTTGVPTAEVQAALEEFVSVVDAAPINESEDECLFEVTLTEETIPARLARHGGQPQSISADETGVDVVVTVPATVDIREFVQLLGQEYETVELLGRRDIERSMQTKQQFQDVLFDQLTDRQLEVLRTAFYAGFFEWPRTSTGEEIAALLDITQPTVNRHLRRSQQRLLEGLFEDDGGSPAQPN